jgi:hypothetical protein
MAHLVSVPFEIQRVALLAATQTPILPPRTCQSCTIGNATTGDLRVITDEAGAQYLIVASGFERVIWFPQPTSGQFRKDMVGFWLQAADAGTVILTWA